MEGTGETEQRREKTKQDGQCVFHEKKLMLEILKRVRKETPVVQSLPRRPRSAMLSADTRPFGYPSLDTDLSFCSLRIYPCCFHRQIEIAPRIYLLSRFTGESVDSLTFESLFSPSTMETFDSSMFFENPGFTYVFPCSFFSASADTWIGKMTAKMT